MNKLRRLFLAFLFILLLIGFSGHLFASASESYHVLSESTCAFHQGINLPANVQSSLIEMRVSPEPTHDDTCALDFVLKISHPPTI